LGSKSGRYRAAHTAIVPLLTQQHRQVAALLDAVERTAGHDRLLAFNELRRYPERVRLDRATPRPPTRPEVLLPPVTSEVARISEAPRTPALPTVVRNLDIGLRGFSRAVKRGIIWRSLTGRYGTGPVTGRLVNLHGKWFWRRFRDADGC